MSDFRVIYRILRTLSDAIDAEELDPQRLTPEAVGASERRFAADNINYVRLGDPNGEELWIAVKARMSGQFLYATHEHKCPDMRTSEGDLIEFKTPKSAKKINSLLVDASEKYANYPDKEKNAIVSLLRLRDAAGGAIDAAGRFENDGTLDHVAVMGHLGQWIKE